MSNYIYKYKITFQQQLKLLVPVFVTAIILFIGFPYILNISLKSEAFFITFAVFFLIDILPTIILHIQYWVKNHNAILILNTEAKELTYQLPSKQLTYRFDNIASLEYYRSYAKGTGWHSFGQYRFYKIVFNDKTEIIITCLMINDIENTLETLLGIESEKYFKLACLV